MSVRGVPDDLHRAVESGRATEVAKALARHDRDVNAVDVMGATALHWAAVQGNVEVVKVLLAGGADPNVRGGGGLTALDFAGDHPEVVALLRGDGTRTPALRSGDFATPAAALWLLHPAPNGFRVAEPVTWPAVVLGSDSEACDIVLENSGVSGVHARIEFHPKGWPALIDLASKGGSEINGIPVGQAPLAIGDSIALGGCQLETVQSVPYRYGQPFEVRPAYQTVLRGPGVTLEQKLAWIDNLCARLATAHAQGLVQGTFDSHRVRLESDGQVDVDLSPRRSGELGSSPEQLRGGAADARSDVFAAAGIAYRILVGRRPFVEKTLPALMYSIANDEPPDLRGLDPIVPGALATWVRRGLAKDPGRRFASGGAMLDALRALAAP